MIEQYSSARASVPSAHVAQTLRGPMKMNASDQNFARTVQYHDILSARMRTAFETLTKVTPLTTFLKDTAQNGQGTVRGDNSLP